MASAQSVLGLVLGAALWAGRCAQAASPAGDHDFSLFISCRKGNDLYRTLIENKVACRRFDSAEEAASAAPTGAAVLVLADQYPEQTLELAAGFFAAADARQLRVYVEYPGALPGIEVGKPRPGKLERAVVTSGFFGPRLRESSILGLNGFHYTPISLQPSHLVAARVAGFDRAVFGLPSQTYPLLFEHPNGRLLVATTALSRFVTGRYAPAEAWQELWRGVLGWLRPNQPFPDLKWTPVVRPSYGRQEALPADAEARALRRGVEWFKRSRLLLHPSRLEAVEHAAHASGMLAPPGPDSPVGDGTLGILEGNLSVILSDGRQMQSVARRGDCTAESAMALACGGRLLAEPDYGVIARNLLDFWMFTSSARKGERADPSHGAYGLIAWGISSPAWYVANYGDDNARLILATLAAAALTGESRWDAPLMGCLLANLRTCGELGFRGDRIDLGPLGKNGWQHYFRRREVNLAPHYESYLWACYLWAYRQTGFALFRDRAKLALRLTMEGYPEKWRWTNGLQQERARMLLPLAWLARLEDTPEHRAWLGRIANDLLAAQDACGALREELGPPGRGQFQPPQTNEEYGANEASLLQQNGDPVSDLLYTVNFAFLGLHEAAAATGDARLREAEDSLARFLCRAQVRSAKRPELDGGWFRAFDFKRWEFWASNSDSGWGAWTIESGWTQGWITSTLALRQLKTSLWELTARSRLNEHFDALRKAMLPDEVLRPQASGQAVRASLVLVPPGPVTERVRLEIRGALINPGQQKETCRLVFHLDEEQDSAALHRTVLEVEPGRAAGVSFRWPCRNHAGQHRVLMRLETKGATNSVSEAVEIISGSQRSTRTIGGAWAGIYHWSEQEGRLWNAELKQMTDSQWRELVRAMHAVGMDIIVLGEAFRNQFYVGKHAIPKDGYHGQAFYPSALFPGRVELAATDAFAAVLLEADLLGMRVFLPVGLYAWFDFTPGSLAWHKQVASELWRRYGNHPSFYGWYVTEEIPGNLGSNEQRRGELVDFFREFQAHVRELAPNKPVMLASNSHQVRDGRAWYPRLLQHCDILCVFGFHRMPPGDLPGEEAASLLQKLCDEAGAHLWLDLEVFRFDSTGALYPRPIAEIISDLGRFPNFEKTLCYQFPGLLNAPWMSHRPGGEATVKLYLDYQDYLRQRGTP